VPGTLQVMSRDYDLLASAFKIVDQIPECKIELILLGKPSKSNGTQLIKKFSSYHNIKVMSFRDEVPQKLFNEILNEVDFCILPINEYIRYGNVNEKAGYSWISGNINDIVSRGIPSILPYYFPLNEKWSTLISTYIDAEDLAQIINDWLRNSTYNKIKSSITEEWKEEYVKYNKALTIKTLREIINS
jgi:hypothetical protein